MEIFSCFFQFYTHASVILNLFMFTASLDV